MSRKIVVLLFLSLGFTPNHLLAFQGSSAITIHASKLAFSERVDNVGDHVVLWNNASWVAYSIHALPFKSFNLEVEAGADTAAGRWPKLGIAFNDPNNIESEFQVQSLTTTTFMQSGTFSPGETDSIIYFVFTNDYWNPAKGQDVNLKLRNVRFTDSSAAPDTTRIAGDSVRVSWLPNTEPDLAGYRIHYGHASRSYTDTIDVRSDTSRVLKLPTNKTYFLAVTAYDAAGNRSDYSREVVFQLNPKDTVNCDINEDGVINPFDWLAFNRSLGAKQGEPNFRENADFNKDGKIDARDETIANETCESQWTGN